MDDNTPIDMDLGPASAFAQVPVHPHGTPEPIDLSQATWQQQQAADAVRPEPVFADDPRTTLKGKVEHRLVRYWMNVGEIVLLSSSEREQLIPMADGTYRAVPRGKLSLVRAGAHRQASYTEWLDPTKEVDAEMIAATDDYIRRFPHVQTDVRIGLVKERPVDPTVPFRTWNDMDPEAVKRTVRETGADLEACYRYEAAKDEIYLAAVERGDDDCEKYPRTRPDVLEALEQLYGELTATVEDQIEQGVAL